MIVPVDDYDGESVVLRIVPTCSDPKNLGAFYFIDNLNVTTHAEHNLALTSISAPGAVCTDTPFEVEVKVTNTGDNEARGYTVELWSGDELIDTRNAATPLASESTAEYVFETSAYSLDGGVKSYYAVVSYGLDEIEADNKSEVAEVGVVAPAVPTPQNLVGQMNGDAVSLAWEAPDMSAAPSTPFTETFEYTDSWAVSVEGWKMLDEDDAPLISIRNPAFQFGAGKKAGWWITPADWSGDGSSSELWKARSGNKFLTSGSVQRGNTPVQCDDWAISPRLNGCEQMLTLYARSFYGEGTYAGYYMEDFDVLYSEGTTAIADFKLAGSVRRAPFSWTKYQFRLPEGSKYFAIRSRSIDQFFLFVDDVTYIAEGGAPAQLTLNGYNLYRDGMKLNSEPLTEPNYLDTSFRYGANHKYVVTALYDKGESRHSNECSIVPSGLEDTFNDNVVVRAEEGCVKVLGAAGQQVDVYSAQGIRVASVTAAPVTTVSLAPGVYVVRVARTAVKVNVR